MICCFMIFWCWLQKWAPSGLQFSFKANIWTGKIIEVKLAKVNVFWGGSGDADYEKI